MNYQPIIQHLTTCGYAVSAIEFCLLPAIKVECEISGYEVSLIHIKVDELKEMPSFVLQKPEAFPRLAHTLSLDKWGVASICVNVPDSVSINYEVPELAFEESLKRHITLLNQCLSDQEWNKKELLREFLAGWYQIREQEYADFLCLSDAGHFELIDVFPPKKKKNKYGLDSYHFGVPKDYNQNSDYSLINNQIKGRGIPTGTGCIVPLQSLIPAPWRKRDLSDWYIKILDFIDPSIRDKLTHTFGQSRDHSFWIIFNAVTDSGKTWFGLHFVLKKDIKGKKNFPLNNKNLEFWDIKAMDIRLFNKERIIPRSGADISLQNKKVLLVGCGSVGSQIANQLASTGIGHLTLVDPDSLSLDNLYRHSLPTSYVNWPKTFGLIIELQNKYPWLDTDQKFCGLLDLRDESLLNSFDLVIIAIGSPSQERIFHDFCIKNEIETAVINTWVEGYGIGGHATLDIPECLGCLRCAYVNSLDFSRGLASNLNFLKSDQSLTKNMAGCGNAFLPYSNLTAIQTALIASGLASKFLLGEITQSSKVSWKGSPTDVINNGFELTDRYQAFTKPLEILPLLNSGCDICNA